MKLQPMVAPQGAGFEPGRSYNYVVEFFEEDLLHLEVSVQSVQLPVLSVDDRGMVSKSPLRITFSDYVDTTPAYSPILQSRALQPHLFNRLSVRLVTENTGETYEQWDFEKLVLQSLEVNYLDYGSSGTRAYTCSFLFRQGQLRRFDTKTLAGEQPVVLHSQCFKPELKAVGP